MAIGGTTPKARVRQEDLALCSSASPRGAERRDARVPHAPCGAERTRGTYEVHLSQGGGAFRLFSMQRRCAVRGGERSPLTARATRSRDHRKRTRLGLCIDRTIMAQVCMQKTARAHPSPTLIYLVHYLDLVAELRLSHPCLHSSCHVACCMCHCRSDGGRS